jgi:hypothetical protein
VTFEAFCSKPLCSAVSLGLEDRRPRSNGDAAPLSGLNDSIETIIQSEGRHRGRSCETKIPIPGSIANLPQTLLGFPIRNKILQQWKKVRTQSAKFTTVRRSEFIEDLRAGTAELYEDFTAVIQGGMSLDQILSRKAINQFDAGVVYDLKLLRQLADS